MDKNDAVKIAGQYATAINQRYDFLKIILFGSYAKGIPTDKSDIDIVIDSKGELLNIDFYGVLEEITTRLGKRVDLFEITELKNNTVMQSLMEQEGIVLYDRQR